MRLYRLCRQKYAELSGFGAKRTGGRYNRKGIAALYTAKNASLAVLEVLVHIDRSEIPVDFVLLEIIVPHDNIVSLSSAESANEFLHRVYDYGHRALHEHEAGFSIPSVIVPADRIIVLYPEAPLSSRVVTMTRVTPFDFDRRLFSPSAAGG